MTSPVEGTQTPEVPSGGRTLKVTWHPDAIRGAIERVGHTVKTATDPEETYRDRHGGQVVWNDLACLIDLANTWVAEQEREPVSVSPITDDTRREAFALARENWDRMRLASVTGVNEEYEKCAVDLIVGKVLDLVAGVSAGCAPTEGAQVAREQTTIHADMVERAAQALYDEVAYQATEWEDARVRDQDTFRQHAKIALSAGLAGYTPVAPAQPSGTDVDGELYWHTPLSSITAGLNLADKPFIRINGDRVDVDEVEADALAQLAAVREARRLASGSQEDSNGD